MPTDGGCIIWPIRPAWVAESAAGEKLTAAPLVANDRLGVEIDDLLIGSILYADMAEAFRRFPSGDWVQVATASLAGVALVRSPAEALADTSFLADGCVVRIEDPEVTAIRCAGPALEFSAMPGRAQGACPAIGEHTEQVMAEADVSGEPATVGPQISLSSPLQGVRALDSGLGVGTLRAKTARRPWR